MSVVVTASGARRTRRTAASTPGCCSILRSAQTLLLAINVRVAAGALGCPSFDVGARNVDGADDRLRAGALKG